MFLSLFTKQLFMIFKGRHFIPIQNNSSFILDSYHVAMGSYLYLKNIGIFNFQKGPFILI